MKQYNASVKYVSNAFTHAERTTNVEVAVVWVDIPHKMEKSKIIEDLKRQKRRTNSKRGAYGCNIRELHRTLYIGI